MKMRDCNFFQHTFLNNIKSTFGSAGERYLHDLPSVIETCVDQWNLRDLSVHDSLSYNFIAFADSDEFGKVILKIGVDDGDFRTEALYARDHQSKATRRAVAVDFPRKAMLLECVEPGYTLDEVEDRAELRAIAVKIIGANPQVYIKDDHPYPGFGSWMKKTFTLVRENKLLSRKMKSSFALAEKLYDQLTVRFPDRYLLHGDLHHENILFDETGGWKVIDPKGVVDCKYLEIGRFIRNELWRIDGNYGGAAFSLMEILLSSFASAFNISSDVVSTAVCIDAAISNSWTLEGEMSESDFIEVMADAEKEMEFFLSYISS